MREQASWIDTAINVILAVCAVGAVVGIIVAAHFVIKFW